MKKTYSGSCHCGAFLDGYDDAGSREKGTRGSMDNLEKELAK